MKSRLLLVGIAVVVGGCRAADETAATDTSVVTRAFPAHPLVTPAHATLRIGDTLRLTVRYPPDMFPPVHPPAWWSSSTPAFALVDSATGLVTARAVGLTTIVAALRTDPAVKGAMILEVVP